MLNKGVILRIILVLILVGIGFGILEYVKNIRAGTKANIALHAAFAGAVVVTDPDAMILGQPDIVSRNIWMGCGDFEPMSYTVKIALSVTSRKVVWLFPEQLWLQFVPFLHRLQGRLAAEG